MYSFSFLILYLLLFIHYKLLASYILLGIFPSKILPSRIPKGLIHTPYPVPSPLLPSYVPGFSFNCMGWTAEEQRVWVAGNLGPTLRAAAYDDLVLMIMDDQRINLPDWAITVRAEAWVAVRGKLGECLGA